MKLSLLDADQRERRAPPPERLRLQRVGPRPAPRGPGAARRDRARRGDRRDPRAQSLQPRVRRARGLRRTRASRSRSATGDRASFLGRNGSLAQPGRARAARRSPAASARGSIPARRCTCRVALAPGETRRLVFLLGQARGRRRGPRARRAPRLRRRPPSRRSTRVRRSWDRDPRRGAGAHAGRLLRPADEPLAPLPGPELPAVGALRLLPAGRRVRLPRPAPGRRWRSRSRGPTSRASTCCAPPAASSSRATSSTGGTSRAAAARAPAARTTCCGCRTRRRTTCGRPATRASSTSACRSSRRPPLAAGRAGGLPPAARVGRARLALRALPARDRQGPDRRRARAAAHRQRRLERRHEPRRLARAAARAPGSASSSTACSPSSRRSATSGATPSGPSATAARPRRLGGVLERTWDGEWYRRGYYDDGTPLGSAQNDECRIDAIAQSWAVLSAAVPAALRRARHGRGPHAPRAARARGCSPCSRRPSTARRRIPATSRAIRPACARTAASTRTPPSGRSWPWRGSGSGDEAVELFHMLNPVNHTRTAADVERYKAEPYVARRRRLRAPVARRPRRAGPGTPARRAGCTGPASRASSASGAAARRFEIDPCIPASWPSLLDRLALRRDALRDRGREPGAPLPRRRAGAARRKSRSPRTTSRSSTMAGGTSWRSSSGSL